MGAADEIVTIVDEHNKVLGAVPRREMPLTWLFDFYFADERTRVWGGAFSCVYDGKVVLQEEEVEDVALMTIAEILRRAETEPFTPDGLYVLQQYLEQQEKP